jgi:hypothetical protein
MAMGCGAASPSTSQPSPVLAFAPRAVASAPPSPAPYQRSQDPIARSLDDERNPYTRRTIARLWIAIARVETGESSERAAVASAALQDARNSAQSQLDPCAGPARAALRWVSTTKQAYERRYLVSIDLLGQDNIESRSLDAQVQALRDDMDELERLLSNCPDRWFESE